MTTNRIPLTREYMSTSDSVEDSFYIYLVKKGNARVGHTPLDRLERNKFTQIIKLPNAEAVYQHQPSDAVLHLIETSLIMTAAHFFGTNRDTALNTLDNIAKSGGFKIKNKISGASK